MFREAKKIVFQHICRTDDNLELCPDDDLGPRLARPPPQDPRGEAQLQAANSTTSSRYQIS